jgi:hypothetical protein
MSPHSVPTTLNPSTALVEAREGEPTMNGFQHLPEYASAAQSYRLEHTRIERSPRRSLERPHLLRRLAAALAPRRAATTAPTAAPAVR